MQQEIYPDVPNMQPASGVSGRNSEPETPWLELLPQVGAEAKDDSERTASMRNNRKRNRRPFRNNPAGDKKDNKHVMVDGSPRYYDKPYTTKKPRPYSPEYVLFIYGVAPK